MVRPRGILHIVLIPAHCFPVPGNNQTDRIHLVSSSHFSWLLRGPELASATSTEVMNVNRRDLIPPKSLSGMYFSWERVGNYSILGGEFPALCRGNYGISRIRKRYELNVRQSQTKRVWLRFVIKVGQRVYAHWQRRRGSLDGSRLRQNIFHQVPALSTAWESLAF